MCLVYGDFIGTLSLNNIMGCNLHIALMWLAVVLCDGSYVKVVFYYIYALVNIYALTEEGCVNIHIGDLKVKL